MKKTMKLALLVYLTLLVCALMFTACDNGNETQTPSNTTDGEPDGTTAPNTDAHVHSFGEWTVTAEPTCDKEGIQTRSCACGEKEEQSVAPQHKMVAEVFETAPTCSTVGVKATEVCTKCGYRNAEVYAPPTGHKLGSEINWQEANGGTIVVLCDVCNELNRAVSYIFRTNGRDLSYMFTDNYEELMGHFDDWLHNADNYDIILPVKIGTFSISAVNRKFFFDSDVRSVVLHNAIVSINESAFENCTQLTLVQMTTSVTKIADRAFKDCSKLAYIFYSGTIAEWNAIDKGADWDAGTGNYTVYCSNGTITK